MLIYSSRKKIIGIGSCRIVYRFGRRSVLKIAKNKRGLLCNRREVKFYYSTPRRLRRHLGKIRKHGRRWLLMTRYRQKFPNSRKYLHRLRQVKNAFVRHGIMPYEMYISRNGKPNRQNLRLDRRGRVIVIDYGNFQQMNE